MSGMEAALASGLLKAAGDKIFALIANEFSSITGVKKDLSELEDIFEPVTRGLSAFQDREIEGDTSYPWVKKLKIFAYDVDDLLEEVRLEAEKQNKDSDGDKHAVADCFCAKPKSFIFQCKTAHKIKAIKARLDELVEQTSNWNTLLKDLPANPAVSGRRDAEAELYLLANVEESEIPKRDQDKVQIVSKLLEPNEGTNDLLIISIVGLGGSGKTTLAKHICHDENIIKHFESAIFRVHVSQKFDVEGLVGKLFEAITKEKSDNHSKQDMVPKISEKLSNGKFLLVLDDAWHSNRNDWEKFMLHVKNGAPGSRVLLTTRSEKVGDAVESWYTHKLECLSEPQSWSFFLKISGWTEDEDPELLQVGKEIVNKCGGLPLAIRILGGVLRGKNEINTWRAIRGSSLWNDNGEDQVFASLKLSYVHLENHLKQCFTFCSIFPKGYEINKDRLIAQWIAHRYVSPRNEERPEDIGSEYFDALVKVGFLQDALETGNNGAVYKMHDLIHDLITQKIVRHEVMTSLTVPTGLTHKCRYLSLMSTSCTEKIDRGLFDKVRAVYTSDGKPALDKLLKKSYHVRSVVLQYATRTPFPLFILKFQHLTYLEIHNFSGNKIPEAIAGCWNLQALYFINCNDLVSLPESIGKLKKLRNLELRDCTDLESLPQSIGHCRDLQCLQLYRCRRLNEIPSSIYELENLRVLKTVETSLQQLPSACREFSNLQIMSFAGCYRLLELPRTFSSPGLHTLNLSGTGLTTLPEWVTSIGLHTLNLSGTRLTTLPEWVTSIGTLEHIDLKDCRELVELPRGIGNLRRLRVLCLKGCWKLRCMPLGLGQLTHLTTLGLFVVGCSGDVARISELENLDMISGDMKIQNLQYVKDPNDAEKACLNRKSSIQSLELVWSANFQEELVSDIEEELVSDTEEELVPDLDVLRALVPPSTVKKLEITGYRGAYFPHWFGDLNGLEQLGINNCAGLTELPESIRSLTSLRELQIRGCAALTELPESIRSLTSLRELQIFRCAALGGLPEWLGELRSLGKLSIYGCEGKLLKKSGTSNFRYLTELNLGGLQNLEHLRGLLVFPSLKSFELQSMPNLGELWTTTTGSEIGDEELEAKSCFPVLNYLCIEYCPKLIMVPYFPPSLEYLRLDDSNEQLLSPGSSSSHRLPPPTNESSSSCSANLAFPHLKELELHSMTGSSSGWELLLRLNGLERLEIQNCDGLTELPESIRSLTSLTEILIYGCDLGRLPEWLGELRSLRKLDVSGTPMIAGLPQSTKHLTSLVNLHIDGWENLNELPEWIGHLASLQELELRSCHALTVLPEGIGQLSALQSLVIYECPALESLPHSIKCLTALQRLRIWHCPGLVERYKEGVGSDWDLISHIPDVYLYSAPAQG